VLVVDASGGRRKIILRRDASRPVPRVRVGDMLRVRRRRVAMRRIVRRGDGHPRLTIVSTIGVAKRQMTMVDADLTNVVRMPTGDDSAVAQFLRYHVLVRVFDGDPDAWLAQLESRGGDGGDIRFVRSIRSRLRQDPTLMTSIRRMVDATPFWRAAEA
jgi:hypothetical protein